MKYAILIYPHQNKRYFDAIKPLCMNELTIMTKSFEKNISNIHYNDIGGLELLFFEADTLSGREIRILNSMSNNQAIFEIKDDVYLKPIKENKKYYVKEDLSSILKYKGKTNESFTDMMINVGIFSSDFYNQFDGPLHILDPMCGKGTTLYQGLIKGYNVSGIEIDKKDIEEAINFLKRYFEYHHYKHNSESAASIVHSGIKCGIRYLFETADSVENYKAKDRRKIELVIGNTVDTGLIYLEKETFHSIITDLPYGVQHAGINNEKLVNMQTLLVASIKGWYSVLKKGGTVVIAYNTYTFKRAALEEILIESGLQVIKEKPYDNFEHWVEQAVNRDIIVARK